MHVRTFLRAASVCGIAALAGTAAADVQSIGFEDYTLGTLAATNNAHTASDGRLPAGADGPRRWYEPGNAATYGEVATRAARTGNNGIAFIRRDITGALDGVIHGVTTPRMAQISGEAAAPTNATRTSFTFSYWFKTGTTTPVGDYRFGAESWGPGTPPDTGVDRYTWHRFVADSGGNLALYSVGMVNDSSLGYFPAADTVVASGLTWGAWYRVETTIQFVNGGDDNDVVTTRLYNASNTLIGTGVDSTWETGSRYALFGQTQIFGVDSIAFQARAGGGAFTSYAGDVAYVDDITISSQSTVTLTPVDACDNDNTVDISIDLTDYPSDPVVGAQFFLQYDTTRLTYQGATGYTTDPMFPLIVLNNYNLGAGTIDFACGVLGGGPGASAPNHIVTLHFTRVGEACASDNLNLVTFRPHVPPTRLSSDSFGALDIPTSFIDLQPFTIDVTPPVIACPPNVTQNADAGGCTAVVDLSQTVTNDFSGPVTLSPTQSPNTWYVDRYAPAGFASGAVPGGTGLVHSINAADCETCRPPSYVSAFYNTQGRKYDTFDAKSMSIDLYVPGAWATTGRRMAGFWGTGFDAGNAISLYPIIEFTSDTATPRFRAYNNGVWIDLGLPTGFVYDAWYTLTMELDGSNVIYTVGDLTTTIPALGTVKIDNVILQGHNNIPGVTYDIYWDNFSYGFNAFATDNCTEVPAITGVRSDALPLNAPFPSGLTNVTWTATDCAGNSSSCVQAVTVNPVNVLNATVELANVNITTFDRCITFDFFNGSCPTPAATVSAVMTFTNRVAAAAIPVPCGNYTCVTARDRLHTLRRTANPSHFGISGLTYFADFVDSGSGNNDALIGGNLNDDQYIDILDFGAYVNQFGVTYGSVDTTCATPFFHADINGDGTVGILDYSFVSTNFLTFREVDCCGNALLGDAGPISDISVFELVGRGDWDIARTSDLNRDSRVNLQDIAFLAQNGVSGCVANYDNQGGVGIDDLFSYINGWFIGHPAADVDNSHAVVIDDLFGYLNAYFVGCN